MNTFKTILLITLLTLPFLLPAQQWRQVYENNAEGERISGSKADLLEAINSGSEVRVSWQTQKEGGDVVSIKHFATARLVDILNEDQVFVQVSIPREQVYRKRKDIMDFGIGSKTYILSTTDSHSETSPPTVASGPVRALPASGKLRHLVNVRWFVR